MYLAIIAAMSIPDDERRYTETIRQNLIDGLKVYEEIIHSSVDPSKVEVQTVFNYYRQKERVNTLDNMKPENYLSALTHLEEWYKDNNLPFPRPAWLDKVRAYWQGRMSGEK